MGLLDWLRRRSQPQPLHLLPYEELAPRFAEDPKAVYEEFMRRLSPLVFAAARDYADRTSAGPALAAHNAAVWHKMAFEQFLPQFHTGAADMLLTRFGLLLRQLLDDKAFLRIRSRFYRQLPLYHMKDVLQRRALEVLDFDMLATDEDPAERVGRELGMDKRAAESVIKAAKKALNDVMAKRFTKADLQRLTEKVLPPQ